MCRPTTRITSVLSCKAYPTDLRFPALYHEKISYQQYLVLLSELSRRNVKQALSGVRVAPSEISAATYRWVEVGKLSGNSYYILQHLLSPAFAQDLEMRRPQMKKPTGAWGTSSAVLQRDRCPPTITSRRNCQDWQQACRSPPSPSRIGTPGKISLDIAQYIHTNLSHSRPLYETSVTSAMWSGCGRMQADRHLTFQQLLSTYHGFNW